MAQIRQTDKATGIVYVYEAEAKWDPVKKQSRYGKRKLVGHVDPQTGEVVPNRPTRASVSSPVSRREFFGTCALLDAVAEESGVLPALRCALPHTWDQALSLAYYMICEGSSPLSRFPRFAATHTTPHGKPIVSQRSSELLASIGEAERDAFSESLARRHGEGDRLFYDTTSISSYSEALSQVRWGRNKDCVPLPQINLAMLVGRESGVPLYYRKVAGNIADVTTVKTLVRDMEPAFTGKVRLVMDRGFWSAANINAMMYEHFKFLIGVPTSLKLFKDAVDTHITKLRSWENFDDATGLYGMRLTCQWDYEKTRSRKGDVIKEKRRSYVYLFFDASRAAEAERDLASLLRACSRELKTGNRIEAHEHYYDEYFDIVRGRPVGKDATIAAATARVGYFALFSNEVMEPFEALAIYHDKDAIEKRFGDVKGLLNFRTPHVSTEETLAGKLFVVFVALVIASWLRKRMKQTGLDEEYTLEGMLDEVETIERYTQEGHRPRICEITGKQRAIFERLGYDLPTTS
ncbi:IS1634 family transposase [Adlercreutzia sp. ZJ141]|uniref:IS1634 family transposase n=1 Tax=Adlercreutzia sp. ZJ141 TaxID=2709406 RepID=UPI0013EAFE60|nr:IS1634 family transposase [Adlercreutzia sp. ZJ141]